MTTEADLAARFDAAFGDGPDHRPLAPALRAGRRRLLGRRVGAATAAAVVPLAGYAAGGGSSQSLVLAALRELERRLGNDDATERAETVTQLREIALLRLEQLTEGI